MHEFSLIADLFRKIESIAREGGSNRVTSVSVRLGALSHISPAHFREHFGQAARGTLAEGARLEIDVSTDTGDPHAQDILLESVDLADGSDH
jgi:hydrogenase nickel incorporation protein HypA/HybF